MAKSTNGQGGKHEVVQLSAICNNVGSTAAGGKRAMLAVSVQIVGPDGVRYRGAGTRLHIAVDPVAASGSGKAKAAKKGAKKRGGRA